MSTNKKVIFSMQGVTKTYPPNKTVLKNIWLSFYFGAKIGVLGLNGSGKSTLLKIIAGLDDNFQGKVEWDGDYKIGYLSQEPTLDQSKTVKENVMDGLGEVAEWMAEYEAINTKLGEPMDDDKMMKVIERQGEIMEKLETANAWELENKVSIAMDALDCPPADSPVTNLSGGEVRRVALARLLISQPDILLLDEPTNHLDAYAIGWLEHYLKQFPGTVIAVTHDRYFLDNVAGWILELDRGEGIPWEGNYSGWLEQKSKRLEKEEKTASKRKKTLQRELEWIRMSPKGRQSKGKARLNAYDKLAGEEMKEKEAKLELFIPSGPRLGDVVVEVDEVAKGYDGRTLMENLTFSIPKNAVVGIIGPNGLGKSTLFRMLMDQERADAGSIKIGDTVKISYVDQSHDELDPEKTIYEVVSGGNDTLIVGGHEFNARAYLSRFNFSGGDQQKKLGVLSGGERNRVHLAMTLKDGGNLILLDEPTNDIDVNTLRALEEGIDNFAGCVMVISHDRWFIDRVATHVLAFEGDGQVVFFEGNYQAYLDSLEERTNDRGSVPTRYKNMMSFN